MTTASTRGTEWNVAEIVETAYQTAGIHDAGWGPGDPGYTEDTAMARKHLKMILTAMQAHGLIARNVIFYDVTLTEGTNSYDMPSYALDVVGDGMFYDATVTDLDQASGGRLVTTVDRQHYLRLTSKGTEGSPYQMWVDRTTRPIKLWLHNIPSETDSTIRVQLHRHVSDVSDSSSTMEFDTFWYKPVVLELAGLLAQAKNLPLTTAALLMKQAQEALELALGQANQQHSNQMVVTHDTPWSRRRR